jgi:TfdA family taurine catabolism dioxygenase TauD
VTYRPIIYCAGGKVQINFATAFLKGSPYVPRLGDDALSDAQEHALDILLHACRKHSMPIEPQQGDMLFVNNFAILHARERFVDGVEEGKLRHLLSVMLRDREQAWPKPNKVAVPVAKKFAKTDLSRPQFFGTVEDYEVFRDKFAMLRHD